MTIKKGDRVTIQGTPTEKCPEGALECGWVIEANHIKIWVEMDGAAADAPFTEFHAHSPHQLWGCAMGVKVPKIRDRCIVDRIE